MPEMPSKLKKFYDEVIAGFLTHDELQKLIDVAKKAILLVPGKKTKSILPVMQVLLIGPKTNFEVEHRVMGLPDAMDSDETKAASMHAIGTSFADESLLPLALCFSSEAWGSQYDPNNRVWEQTIGRPANDPNRMEIAQISCLNLKRTAAFTYATIKRDAEDVITEVGEFSQVQFLEEDEHMRLLIRVYKGYQVAVSKKGE